MVIRKAIVSFLIIALGLNTILPPGYADSDYLRPLAAKNIMPAAASQEALNRIPRTALLEEPGTDHGPAARKFLTILHRLVNAFLSFITGGNVHSINVIGPGFSGFAYACLIIICSSGMLDKVFLPDNGYVIAGGINNIHKYLLGLWAGFTALYIFISKCSDERAEREKPLDVRLMKYLMKDLHAGRRDADEVVDKVMSLIRRGKISMSGEIEEDFHKVCAIAATFLADLRRSRRIARWVTFVLLVVVPISIAVYSNFDEIKSGAIFIYKAWRHRGALKYLPVTLGVVASVFVAALTNLFSAAPAAAGQALVRGFSWRRFFELRKILWVTVTFVVTGLSGIASSIFRLLPFFNKVQEKTYHGFTGAEIKSMVFISVILLYGWILLKSIGRIFGALRYRNVSAMVIASGALLSAIAYSFLSDVNGPLAVIPGMIILGVGYRHDTAPEFKKGTTRPEEKTDVEDHGFRDTIGRILVGPLVEKIEEQLGDDGSTDKASPDTSPGAKSSCAGVSVNAYADLAGSNIPATALSAASIRDSHMISQAVSIQA